MSKDLNKAMCTGHLGADPELRYTESGASVATFRVASHRSYRDQQSGREREETEWFHVVVWNQLADMCHQHLRKGHRVYVEGRLHTNKQPQEDGSTRFTVELVAADVIFLDRIEPAAAAEPATPPVSAVPRTPAEAEQRFYARYGEQIGGADWRTVQNYLGRNFSAPATVAEWMDVALSVRDASNHQHTRANTSPGAQAAARRRS